MKKLILLVLDYTTPARDYFCVLSLGELVTDWGFPALISVALYLNNGWNFTLIETAKLSLFFPNVINLLAILTGFSIACLTILISGSSKIMESFRDRPSGRSCGGEKFTYYQLVLINFTWVISVELFLLALDVAALITALGSKPCPWNEIVICCNVFLIMHIMALNLRNVTNVFFSLWRNSSN
jgi:hypothetical protein